MTCAFGGHDERVTTAEDKILTIKRGITKIENRTTAVLKFITYKEVDVSKFYVLDHL